ncbi:MAG: S8 family serine peptidase [Bacteroidota bacterium]|nr:S8 family serine peptidase [Bacteroidota bacterium]MDP4190523.1 S8 family serine peptidase [Bacteroidota bacterium]MDP4193674.1 S8 family serine peptidase [Bacteroidota bacterium]
MSGSTFFSGRRFFSLVFIFLLCALSFAQTENSVRLVLSVKQSDYAKVKQAIEAVKGQVNIEHKFVQAIAVTLPVDKVQSIIRMPEVLNSVKDLMVSIPDDKNLQRGIYGNIMGNVFVNAEKTEGLNPDEIKQAYQADPANYDPYTNKLTNANKFIKETGHIGEGVIVAIIDAGVSTQAVAVSSRILGGENFTGDGIPATSPQNYWHGTAVACCVGANAIFGFSSPRIQNAVKNYAPNSVIKDYFGTGIDGIPMVGQAPGALFYALKVFKTNGASTPSSVIAAALERAIELKEQYNQGAGGLNIRIINMSLGGATLFAGHDPDYASLVQRAIDDGMLVVVSAGNEGPSGMTIGDPGDCIDVVTVGATSDATHERILRDYQYGANYGYLFRPVNNHMTTYFSSRGPNADGRPDPDITAPGDWRFMQTATGGIIWGSGTSFSAPTVAGAAALLISANPSATPDQVRAALLNGTDKDQLTENPGLQDQGFGFLNVNKAYKKLTAGVSNPLDIGRSGLNVAANIALQDNISIVSSTPFTAFTGLLRPGQRAEYFYPVPRTTQKITISISNITPELPSDQQNPLFKDDILVAIQGAITSTGDYLQGTPAYLSSDQTFVLEGQDLSMGLLRVTILGDWTNAGKVAANISIATETHNNIAPTLGSKIAEGDVKEMTFNIPQGTQSLETRLYWTKGWETYPTNDLDVILTDPNGQIINVDVNADNAPDGQTLKMPEIVTLTNPIAGTWKATVIGYTVFSRNEEFHLYNLLNGKQIFQKKASPEITESVDKLIPAEFGLQQNMPNPFNPTTIIKYDLPLDTYTTLKVYNSLGQLVRVLVDEFKTAGYHSVLFNGKDSNGNGLSSGIYIYQLNSGQFVKSGKMIMLK